MTQNYHKTENFRIIMRKEKLLQNLYLQLRSTTDKIFIQQKYYFETLQTMEILLLKALREEDFDPELQQISLKLILLAPTTNAVSKRLYSMLCRLKTYLRSSITEEPLNPCLIATTYKKQVDKEQTLPQKVYQKC